MCAAVAAGVQLLRQRGCIVYDTILDRCCYRYRSDLVDIQKSYPHFVSFSSR